MKDLTLIANYYKSQSVEDVMIPVIPHEKDDYFERVFKTSPLLGDTIIPQTIYSKYYSFAKEIIDAGIKYLLSNGTHMQLRLKQHEVLTLVVIELAKKWNKNTEGSFTKYVALSFGYNDEANRKRVWSIVTKSMDIAMRQNKKLYILNKGNREFYETVMVHSFGPVDSWDPVFDLLFVFYKDNLSYYFNCDDPLFDILVKNLKNVLEKDSDEEKELQIVSQQYRLRIGIRRLIQNCPQYSIVLFKDVVQRIHELTSGSVEPTNRYVLRLVDRWYFNRIREQSIKTSQTKEAEEIAFDYNSIVVRYYQSADDLYLRIPTIRINSSDEGEAYALISICGKSSKEPLKVFGNELGRTIQHKLVKLDTSLIKEASIDISIKICYGQQVLHDSGRKLYRQALFFFDGKEVSVNNIIPGRYVLVCPRSAKISGEQIEITSPNNIISPIVIHKGFEMRFNGSTISIDSSSIKDFKIVEPDHIQGIGFSSQGKYYKIVLPGKSLKFYSSDIEKLTDYSICLNGNKKCLSELADINAGNRAILQFDPTYSSTYEVEIVRTDTNKIVFSNSYYVSELSYEFDREFYTNACSYSNAVFSLHIGEESFDIRFDPHQSSVCYKYQNGEIIANVPCLKSSFNRIVLKHGRYLMGDELSHDSALSFSNTSNKEFSVTIGEDTFQSPDVISLEKYKNIPASQRKISVICDREEYTIGEIIYSPKFIDTPRIQYDENRITCIWEPFFVGGDDVVELHIQTAETDLVFPLRKNGVSCSVFETESFTEGEYNYVVAYGPNNIKVVSGSMFIGDEKYSRFYNKVICLRYITDDNSDVASSIQITPVYVEKIKYIRSEYVPSEDGIYDIYSGQMYKISKKGEKLYFSDDYIEEKHKYKVNPVKIIYLNDNYLRIVNQDDEGLMFFSYEHAGDMVYQITDREPTKSATGFSDVLFFVNDLNQDDVKVISYSGAETATGKIVPEDGDVLIATAEERVPKRVRVKDIKPEFSQWKDVLQDRVVTADVNERIIVNAGPGTGKTWTLIERIIYLVNSLNVDPETIQVLCFSRAAVEEIRERMKNAILAGRADLKTNYVDIRTFDSFVTQFLYWIKDSDYDVIKKSFQIEKLNYDERIKLFTNVIQKEPDIIAQCEHLIVDEVQDLVLSRADLVLEMIRQIPTDSGVTLLGDCCQAIYGYQVDDVGTTTEAFYKRIYDDESFVRYSFSQNHRQTEWWDDICKQYRASIMSSVEGRCNDSLKKICELIPSYDTDKISKFTEDSLSRIQEKGTVAILTRSNAQALEIADVFSKRNIDFTIRRKRNENKLNKWIGYLFNNPGVISFDRNGLFSEINRIVWNNPVAPEDYEEIWRTISENRSHSTGRLSCRDILLAIRNRATNRRFFIDENESKTIISTVHRSKGREYDNVIVESDLVDQSKDDIEEHRVSYVALSRAKSNVYTVHIPNIYFRTLDSNRRCFSWNQRAVGKTLAKFEVGFDMDIDEYSFCEVKGRQSIIKNRDKHLIGKRVYLRKSKDFVRVRTYDVIIEDLKYVIGTTGPSFVSDLEDAIRQLKNLPSSAPVFDSLFPSRFVDIYISDISTSIGMVKGNEFDVVEYGDMICWNTLLIEGYARAEYNT